MQQRPRREEAMILDQHTASFSLQSLAVLFGVGVVMAIFTINILYRIDKLDTNISGMQTSISGMQTSCMDEEERKK